jgi:3-oxoacyl-[acyl-carrier-protein] synthase II
MERVVITGLGAITPVGLTVADFWRNLITGVYGVGPITLFDASDLPTQIAAEVKGFDPGDHMDRRLVRHSHRSTQFALAATYQALQDAGLSIHAGNAPRVGVVINTGGGAMNAMEDAAYRLQSGGPRKISPFFVPMTMTNSAACQVSIATGAKGPVLTSTLACASGNYALVDAMRMLRLGEAEAIIAGGTEAGMMRLMFTTFCSTGALSRRNDEPERASRPFDRNRDGFVYGEGAGVMILETEPHARARGARIYAEVAGGALTGDAFHITAPDPDGDGARRAMVQALHTARMQPKEIDVVFAHGTSTILNDVVWSA